MGMKAEKVNGEWNVDIGDEKESLGALTALVRKAADNAGMSFSDYLAEIKKEEEKEDALNSQRLQAEKSLNDAVKNVLKTLPDDEADIFALLSGVDDTYMSDQELAKKYHKSVSSIHHIADAVAKKVRNDPDVHLQAIILNQYLK